MNAFTEEQERRSFFADRLEVLFRSRPLEWISVLELVKVGGLSWRSRIACDLRQKRGLTVEWNKQNKTSAYMFKPFKPLGRSAETRVESPQRSLF